MKVCLVLTHKCNLGCTYCYAGPKFSSSMSLETGLKGLQLAFSRPGPVEVSFFGGEPMIAFPAMARLTRLASALAQRQQRQVQFVVTTNATILNENHLRFFKHYNFFVGLSVDGIEEVQDRHRPFVGGRGSGELVWRNLEKACQVLESFRVLMVVRTESLEALPHAIERMYRLGVSRISLLPDVEADWSTSRPRLEEVYARLATICYLSLLTEEPLMLSPFLEHHPAYRSGRGTTPCGFGSEEVAISPAGNVYPCARLVGPDVRSDVRIGSLDLGLDEARILELQRLAEKQLSGCGSGGCHCLALMPGDMQLQMQNVSMFSQVIGQVCQEAELVSEGVAA